MDRVYATERRRLGRFVATRSPTSAPTLVSSSIVWSGGLDLTGKAAVLKTAGRNPVEVRILCPPLKLQHHPETGRERSRGGSLGRPARTDMKRAPDSYHRHCRRAAWSFAAFYFGVKAPRDRKPPSGVFTNNPR